MKKLALALGLYLAFASGAFPQAITMPPPAGVTIGGCVYNASPPTITSIGYMQCTNTGALIVSIGGSGGGTVIVQGAQSNASSGVAPTSINVPTNGYNYVWNGTSWDQAVGIPLNSNNAVPTIGLGTNAIATNQVSVASSATLIVAARTGITGTGRKSVTITNITGTAPFYIGNTGLTTSTGMYVGAAAGASITLDTQAAIFGIVSTTAQTVSFVETF